MSAWGLWSWCRAWNGESLEWKNGLKRRSWGGTYPCYFPILDGLWSAVFNFAPLCVHYTGLDPGFAETGGWVPGGGYLGLVVTGVWGLSLEPHTIFRWWFLGKVVPMSRDFLQKVDPCLGIVHWSG